MARDHARVLCRIWRDRDFIARTYGAQRMYFLLLSQQQLSWAGVTLMTIHRWAGLAPDTVDEDIRRWLAELQDHEFVVADGATQEILVRSYMRYNDVHKSPNVLKAAVRQAAEVESGRLRHVLAAEFRKLGRPEADEAAEAIEPSFPEPLANPSANPSRKGSGNPSGTLRDGNPSGRVPERVPQTLREPFDSGSDQAKEDEAVAGAQPFGKGSGNPSANPSENPSRKGPVEDSGKVFKGDGGCGGKGERGTRIREDFTPTPDMLAWARSNCPLADLRRENEKFVNFWLSKAGRDAAKRDWPRTWRNWMIKSQEQAEQRRPGTTKSQRVASLESLLDRDDDDGASGVPAALPGGF